MEWIEERGLANALGSRQSLVANAAIPLTHGVDSRCCNDFLLRLTDLPIANAIHQAVVSQVELLWELYPKKNEILSQDKQIALRIRRALVTRYYRLLDASHLIVDTVSTSFKPYFYQLLLTPNTTPGHINDIWSCLPFVEQLLSYLSLADIGQLIRTCTQVWELFWGFAANIRWRQLHLTFPWNRARPAVCARLFPKFGTLRAIRIDPCFSDVMVGSLLEALVRDSGQTLESLQIVFPCPSLFNENSPALDPCLAPWDRKVSASKSKSLRSRLALGARNCSYGCCYWWPQLSARRPSLSKLQFLELTGNNAFLAARLIIEWNITSRFTLVLQPWSDERFMAPPPSSRCCFCPHKDLETRYDVPLQTPHCGGDRLKIFARFVYTFHHQIVNIEVVTPGGVSEEKCQQALRDETAGAATTAAGDDLPQARTAGEPMIRAVAQLRDLCQLLLFEEHFLPHLLRVEFVGVQDCTAALYALQGAAKWSALGKSRHVWLAQLRECLNIEGGKGRRSKPPTSQSQQALTQYLNGPESVGLGQPCLPQLDFEHTVDRDLLAALQYTHQRPALPLAKIAQDQHASVWDTEESIEEEVPTDQGMPDERSPSESGLLAPPRRISLDETASPWPNAKCLAPYGRTAIIFSGNMHMPPASVFECRFVYPLALGQAQRLQQVVRLRLQHFNVASRAPPRHFASLRAETTSKQGGFLDPQSAGKVGRHGRRKSSAGSIAPTLQDPSVPLRLFGPGITHIGVFFSDFPGSARPFTNSELPVLKELRIINWNPTAKHHVNLMEFVRGATHRQRIALTIETTPDAISRMRQWASEAYFRAMRRFVSLLRHRHFVVDTIKLFPVSYNTGTNLLNHFFPVERVHLALPPPAFLSGLEHLDAMALLGTFQLVNDQLPNELQSTIDEVLAAYDRLTPQKSMFLAENDMVDETFLEDHDDAVLESSSLQSLQPQSAPLHFPPVNLNSSSHTLTCPPTRRYTLVGEFLASHHSDDLAGTPWYVRNFSMHDARYGEEIHGIQLRDKLWCGATLKSRLPPNLQLRTLAENLRTSIMKGVFLSSPHPAFAPSSLFTASVPINSNDTTSALVRSLSTLSKNLLLVKPAEGFRFVVVVTHPTVSARPLLESLLLTWLHLSQDVDAFAYAAFWVLGLSDSDANLAGALSSDVNSSNAITSVRLTFADALASDYNSICLVVSNPRGWSTQAFNRISELMHLNECQQFAQIKEIALGMMTVSADFNRCVAEPPSHSPVSL